MTTDERKAESALERCKREHPDHWGLYYGNSCDECWEAFRAEFNADFESVRAKIDQRDDLAHQIREAWQAPGVVRYDSDDEWRMAVAAADVALGGRRRVSMPGTARSGEYHHRGVAGCRLPAAGSTESPNCWCPRDA